MLHRTGQNYLEGQLQSKEYKQETMFSANTEKGVNGSYYLLTKNTSVASNSTHKRKAVCAFSTVFGLPVRHLATMESQTSFAYLQQNREITP